MPKQVGGGMFSVALSLASPPVAVSHHRALSSSDFPPRPRPAGNEFRTNLGRSDRLAHFAAFIVYPRKRPRAVVLETCRFATISAWPVGISI